MAVITPPQYSLQEANIVSFLTELHPSPGQSGMQSIISWLDCFLNEKKGRVMVLSQLHSPSASAWSGAHTGWAVRALSVMSCFHSFLTRTGQLRLHRSACAAYVGIRPCTLRPAGTLYQVFFACISGFTLWEMQRDGQKASQVVMKAGSLWKLLRCCPGRHKGGGERDSRNLLTLLQTSILHQWMRVCVSTSDGNL